MQMTQIWANDKVMAVTPVLAGPCTVTQVKTKETDKYDALQVAFGNRKEKNINKKGNTFMRFIFFKKISFFCLETEEPKIASSFLFF